MNSTIFAYEERFKAIAYNAKPPKSPSDRTEAFLRMIKDMRNVFSESAKDVNLAFDDISAVFVMLCTFCAKCGFDKPLIARGLEVAVGFLLSDISDTEEYRFLSALGKMIFGLVNPAEDATTNYLDEAYSIYPDNEVVNLYRLVGLVQLLYSDNADIEGTVDNEVSLSFNNFANLVSHHYSERPDWRERAVKDMVSAYCKLSVPLRKFVFPDKLKGLNEMMHMHNLPHFAYASYVERTVMSLAFAIPEAFKEIKDSFTTGCTDNLKSADLKLPSVPFMLGTPCLVNRFVPETIRAEVRTAERDRALAEKDAVIRDFTHTYGNMKATGLYGLAQALLKSDDIEMKRLGRQALLEYGIKQDLTKAVYMMRLRFEGNTGELRQLLRDSIAESPGEGSECVQDIISSALQLSLLRAFYDRSDKKAALALAQMKKAVIDGKLNPVRDSFENSVVFAGGSAVDWMSEQIAAVKVSLSESWGLIVLRKESYASIFLRDIFAECFFNALKYADLKKPISLNLREDENTLSIQICNTAAEQESVYNGVRLTSKNPMLNIVNGRSAESSTQSVTWEKVGDMFCTAISLDKQILKGE